MHTSGLGAGNTMSNPSPLRYTVQPRQCHTCIFRPAQQVVCPQRLAEIQAYLLQGNTHLCHSPDQAEPASHKRNTHACRGGRDWQLQIWHRLGFLDQPTDEALDLAMRQMGIHWEGTGDE